jgi:CDP-diacylglycerol--glycerol-3-phosphate 3-phosphatidyltransferase
MNIPNRLSLTRIAIVPIIVLILLFPYRQFNVVVPTFTFGFVNLPIIRVLVFFLFLFASLTDALDGFIARRYNLVTTLGKFIDPIADKMLTNTLFIIYATQGLIPVVPVILMIWRDVMVDGVRLVSAEQGKVIDAGFLGKVKTFAQMVALLLITINNLPFELINLPLATFLLWFSALISLFSGFSYVYKAKDLIFQSK